MKPIKFRVREKATGEIVGYEWIQDSQWIRQTVDQDTPEVGTVGTFIRGTTELVRESFTGRIAKDGTELFEHDLIQIKHPGQLDQFSGKKGQIFWNNENCAFAVRFPDGRVELLQQVNHIDFSQPEFLFVEVGPVSDPGVGVLKDITGADKFTPK